MSTSSYAIGQRLRITTNIYEAADDHAPGGYLALKGDTVVVRGFSFRNYFLRVSHENFTTGAAFLVGADEVEPIP